VGLSAAWVGLAAPRIPGAGRIVRDPLAA
jgi:hypothetical protein